MRKPKIIKCLEATVITKKVDVRVILRKDFYDNFDAQLKKIIQDTGATYFGHNIIKNYGETGHTVSTFCNHEKWHDIYWDKLCLDDSVEKTIHQAVLKNNFGVISLELGNNSKLCHEERKRITHVKDGICFSFKRPENYIETMSVGWNDLDSEKLDTDYILQLTSLLKPIRDYHWDVHNTI